MHKCGAMSVNKVSLRSQGREKHYIPGYLWESEIE